MGRRCGAIGLPASGPTRCQAALRLMFEAPNPVAAPPIWQVGALCRAIADALSARFNPVAVHGEVSGFSRAASGHCYLTLKDETGQIRCAMFRRAATLLSFQPKDGDLVEVRGRLDVYGPRGDLQLVVESMSRAGIGHLLEEFYRLKARLEAEGLFETSRKRPLRRMPRGIAIVTSLGAAALADVLTTLKRRLPHVPVLIAPASVQGLAAPGELVQALSNVYQAIEHSRGLVADISNKTQRSGKLVATSASNPELHIDVILLVRGGGSIDDLWAFNDERLARTIAASPVPVISGVGHETDFTIADFVADQRAPTPTAAAELVSQPQAVWLNAIDALDGRIQDAVTRQLDEQAQRLDRCAKRIGRPSLLLQGQRLKLAALAARKSYATLRILKHKSEQTQGLTAQFPLALARAVQSKRDRLERSHRQLQLLDPKLVLQRGYAWLVNAQGQAVTRTTQARPGQALRATLIDGELDLTVAAQPSGQLF